MLYKSVITEIITRRMERDSVRIAQAVLQRVCEHSPLPFELRVLEALLDETARQVQRGAGLCLLIAAVHASANVSSWLPGKDGLLNKNATKCVMVMLLYECLCSNWPESFFHCSSCY